MIDYLMQYFLPINSALNHAEFSGKQDYDGGKESRRALSRAEALRLLDFLPLPRAIIALIGVFRLSSARTDYSESFSDADGFGGGTFGDADGRLFLTIVFGLPIDIVVIWFIFF